MLWVRDAPIYGEDDNTIIEQFVDKYITCNTEALDYQIAKLHIHHHTKKRTKTKRKMCRFGFLQPPMKATTILEPCVDKKQDSMQIAKKLTTILETSIYDTSVSFEDFLVKINMTENEYIIAIRSTLLRPTLFLTRKPAHIWNNSFALQIPHLWQANTDAQFVLNAYAAATYCSSYMTKANNSMTTTFAKIRANHMQHNIDAINMVTKLGNALLNLQQMAAQQAAHIILSLPLNYSSYKCIFMDTSIVDSYTFVLKTSKVLSNGPDESQNIACKTLIDHYIERLETLADICLAEFVTKYTIAKAKITQQTRPQIIRYNKHIDSENYYREKLLLYVPFWVDENSLKKGFTTWQHAFANYEKTIHVNEAKYTYYINEMWGDMDNAIINTNDEEESYKHENNMQRLKRNENEQYNLQLDLDTIRHNVSTQKITSPFEIADHPQYRILRCS